MPDIQRRPWRIALPLLIVIVICIVWSLYWFVAIGLAKQSFAEQRAKLAQRSMNLKCTGETWGGYPFRFEYSCTSPVLKMDGNFEVRATGLLAVALAYNPWQVAILVDGPSRIGGISQFPLTIQHLRGLAVLTFRSGNELSISAELPKLVIPEVLSVDQLRIDARQAAESRIEYAITVEKLNYHPAAQPALPLEHGTMRGFLTPDRKALIEKFEVSQASVRLWGHGEVKLDKLRRPSGQISTETNDLNGLLELLEPHFELTDDQKSGLRTMLGLLGNETKAEIIAKDGSLFIGPFKAGELAPLF